MPETPEREIEKQLRQHAEARRNAAGEASLHPATRRVLQAEVRQRWGGTGGQRPKAPWFARLGPRFALAFGLLAMMVTAAVLLLGPAPREHADFAKLNVQDELKKNLRGLPADAQPASGPMSDRSAMSAPAPMASARPTEDSSSKRYAESSVGGSVVLADNESVAESAAPKPAAPATDEYSAATALASKSAAPAAEGRFFASSGVTAGTNDKDGLSGTAKMDERAKLTSLSREVLAITNAGQEGLGQAQAFRNVAVATDEKARQSVAVPVLMNFTVAQNGNQLTVVDADGSVYQGTVEPVVLVSADESKDMDAFARRRNDAANPRLSGGIGGADGQGLATFESNQPAARPATAALAANIAPDTAVIAAAEMQNWQFKVEGTNRSLQQRVIFTGNLIQNSGANNIFISNQSGTASRQNYQQQPTAQNQFNYFNNALPPNNAIKGRVKLDNRKETELNALSVEP